MLIIGQDKRQVINFDGIFELYITIWSSKNDFALDPDCWCIKADKLANSRNSYFLGQYKTEERAKEVLQEIVQAYVDSKKSKEAQKVFGYSVIPSNTYYEMPEE